MQMSRSGTYDQLCRERFERLLQRASLNQVERHAGRFLRHLDGLLAHGGQSEITCVDAIVVTDDGTSFGTVNPLRSSWNSSGTAMPSSWQAIAVGMWSS